MRATSVHSGSIWTKPVFVWLVLAWIVALFTFRNLPWTLNGYDQAKQAYAAYELVTLGSGWYQHTPLGYQATKPPLAAWLSAGLYALTGSWDLAWRLPSFLAALALLGMLYREGSRTLGRTGGVLAAAAFGLNLFSMRLATLVRTDMLLAFLIFLAGAQILRHVESGRAWSLGERVGLGLLMLMTLFLKGPVIYAFLLPSWVIFAILRARTGGRAAWSGAAAWILPLLPFIAWAAMGSVLNRAFYDQVVRREFLCNFVRVYDVDVGQGFTFDRQPFWFYLPHMLEKWAPWSLLLVGLVSADRAVRRALKSDPGALWLACWAVGGFVVMSAVPAKRLDRMFPILPPLSLLLVRAVAASSWRRLMGSNRVRTLAVLIIAAAVGWGGYAVSEVIQASRGIHREWQRFGAQVHDLVSTQGWRFAVVGPEDEALLLYLQQTKFMTAQEARRRWQNGELDALVVTSGGVEVLRNAGVPFSTPLSTPEREGVESYWLVVRDGADKPQQRTAEP